MQNKSKIELLNISGLGYELALSGMKHAIEALQQTNPGAVIEVLNIFAFNEAVPQTLVNGQGAQMALKLHLTAILKVIGELKPAQKLEAR